MATIENMPNHVAIIMDGNGRWAAKRGMPRVVGHKKGADAVRVIIETARKAGLRYLSLYAFSTENWKRPENEVNALMKLLKYFSEKEATKLAEVGIKVRFIGNRTDMPDDLQRAMRVLEKVTECCSEMVLQIAVSYGGRDELVRAVNMLRKMPRGITEADISGVLDTAGVPDPDLLIRTSGEYRTSNFMPWQCTYSELAFTETLWPDFTAEEFRSILADYGQRERRFGGVKETSLSA